MLIGQSEGSLQGYESNPQTAAFTVNVNVKPGRRRTLAKSWSLQTESWQ